MRKSGRQRRIPLVLRFAAAVLTVAVGGSTRGADESLPAMVKAALDAVRLNRAGMYDVFESSTLGKTAGPSEFAATQRNMRAYCMTPAAALELSEARKAELGALYGRVALFGRPRAGKAFDGALTLHVGRDGKFMSVQVKLPIDGGYSANWPSDCAKSKTVADAAVQYVIHRGDDTFWRNLKAWPGRFPGSDQPAQTHPEPVVTGFK